MARNVFQPSFYRWAMNLPESEPVALMRVLAPQIFAELGGGAVLRNIGFHEAILARWDSDAERKPGDREAMRCMGAIDRGYTKVAALREQAWLQARAEVFQRTGERIPLPQTPETFEHQQSAEEAAIVRDLSAQIRALGAMSDELVASNAFAGVAGSGSGQGLGQEAGQGLGSGSGLGSRSGSENGSDTSAPQPVFQYAEGPQDEPPTNKQVKLGVQRLIAARVDRPLVLKLRELGKSGRITRAKWNDSLHKLLTA